jgi:hypothetical protein
MKKRNAKRQIPNPKEIAIFDRPSSARRAALPWRLEFWDLAFSAQRRAFDVERLP